MKGQGGLTGSLRPVDLYNTAPGDAADAQSQVQGQGAGGQGLHIDGDIVAKAHDGALAIVFLDLGDGGFQGFLLIADGGSHHSGDFLFLSHLQFLTIQRFGDAGGAGCYILPMTTRSMPWVSFRVAVRVKPADISISLTAWA